jgi:glycosyltransferase involved in cell wall biosynthesis
MESTAPAPGAVVSPRTPLRVLHIISSLQIGGLEQFAVRLAREQRSRGHDVAVMALQGGPLSAETEAFGVRALVLGGNNAPLRALRGAVRMALLRPHVVHAHNETTLHYASLAKMVTAARLVMTYHGRGRGGARRPRASEWRRTDAVVVVSEAVIPEIESPIVHGRISVIKNGVEASKPSCRREEIRARLELGDRPTGIIAARLDGLKGHDTLLRALARVRQRSLPVTVLIAGDGAERPALETLARDLGLGGESVRFLGFRSDVGDLLAAADFFVLPSLTEGLPLSILEAMSHGLPIIATPVGGIPEVVRDGEEGVLVPVGDEAVLAAAISRLAGDSDAARRLGRCGRERVRTEFSFERMTAEYDRLYHRLCSRRTTG